MRRVITSLLFLILGMAISSPAPSHASDLNLSLYVAQELGVGTVGIGSGHINSNGQFVLDSFSIFNVDEFYDVSAGVSAGTTGTNSGTGSGTVGSGSAVGPTGPGAP